LGVSYNVRASTFSNNNNNKKRNYRNEWDNKLAKLRCERMSEMKWIFILFDGWTDFMDWWIDECENTIGT